MSARSGAAGGCSAPDQALPEDLQQAIPSDKMLSIDALNALIQHDWPGNVREVRNAIERIVVTSEGEVIGMEDLPRESGRPTEAPCSRGRMGCGSPADGSPPQAGGGIRKGPDPANPPEIREPERRGEGIADRHVHPDPQEPQVRPDGSGQGHGLNGDGMIGPCPPATADIFPFSRRQPADILTRGNTRHR